MKIFLLVIGIVLMSIGVAIHYLWGYKPGWLLEGAFYVPVIFGWLALLFLMALFHPGTRMGKGEKRTLLQNIGFRVYFLSYLVWLAGLIAILVYADNLLEQRVVSILQDGPTAYSTALVVNIDERSSKTGTKYYAIIEYPTAAGQVRQSMKEQEGMYVLGQRLQVKYSTRYPDMFTLVSPYGK
jgi:hypothetical protein